MKKLLSLLVVLGTVSVFANEVDEKCPCNKPKPPVTAEVNEKCPCTKPTPRSVEEVVELPAN
jgi:hypothetical protein